MRPRRLQPGLHDPIIWALFLRELREKHALPRHAQPVRIEDVDNEQESLADDPSPGALKASRDTSEQQDSKAFIEVYKPEDDSHEDRKRRIIGASLRETVDGEGITLDLQDT